MAYTIQLKPRAERELDRLPLTIARRIWRKLLALEKAPRPRGTSKLEGTDGYRIRIGDYRVVYIVDDREQTVDIIRVAHRKEVYR
jgi:mRNA interferase RelE/StbE